MAEMAKRTTGQCMFCRIADFQSRWFGAMGVHTAIRWPVEELQAGTASWRCIDVKIG